MGDSYIIAIDFGTAYSGYSFSITPQDADIDPKVKMWGEEFGLETPKTPTCILFDQYEGFMSFGYEAKEAYTRMREDEARKKFFFESFKMELYGRKLDDDLLIEATNGKSMKALKVFTEALRFMKDDALKTINNTAGCEFTASNFTWVLTVPAIWDPSAKQFMRAAAIQAGLVNRGKEGKLIFALEPEAASIWCKKLPAEGFVAQNRGEKTLEQSPGTSYIVVDCGGGTIDVTVHEVLEGETLKEMHKASGNDMGGQTVDRKFKELLREIFSDGVWDKYEKEFPGEVQKIMYDFMLFKKKEQDVRIYCPSSLYNAAKKKKKVEKFFRKIDNVSWDAGSIEISKRKLRSFFEESLTSISDILLDLLKKNSNIDYILLVGGYAESQILQQHVITQFSSRCKVLSPFRAQEAIVKGALMFGRSPGVIRSRKSAFTYGFEHCPMFDASKHWEEKKKVYEGVERCEGVFQRLVAINEEVGSNEFRRHTLYPVEPKQNTMKFSFYRSEKANPMYVDEDGVEEIGAFNVNMPDTKQGTDRPVRLNVKFGDTEMTATTTVMETGSTTTVELDFMAH